MKLKSKFISKLTALVTAMSLTASLLPTTALAGGPLDHEDTAGPMGMGLIDASLAYQTSTSKNLSWKIDAYVSTNPTGKIDVENDYIDSDSLKWVGGVLYDNFHYGGTRRIYVQTDDTNSIRNGRSFGVTPEYVNGWPTGVQLYQLPHVTELDRTKQVYDVITTSGEIRTTAHRTDNPLNLPPVDSGINSLSYSKIVASVINNNENLSTILHHINLSLGGSGDSADKIYAKILPILGEQVQSKLLAIREELSSQNKNGDDALKRLLPNSVDKTIPEDAKDDSRYNCIVQWCFIVMPMYGFAEAGSKNQTFWEVISDNQFTLIGTDDAITYIGLDSYMAAQYNESTKSLFQSSKYYEHLKSNGIKTLAGLRPKNGVLAESCIIISIQ